jgi:hypothetical protein
LFFKLAIIFNYVNSVQLDCQNLTGVAQFYAIDLNANKTVTITSGGKYSIENNVLKISEISKYIFIGLVMSA